MSSGNFTSIVNIQRAEGIVLHESNFFNPLKGPLVFNCSTISFHMLDTISIEHQLKRANKLRNNSPSKSCEDVDWSHAW